MTDPQDYYQVLRVSPDATQDEIKQAFRRLARRFHPDLNPDNPDAEAQFRQICEAYDVLGDAVRRQRYDQNQPSQPNQSNHSKSPGEPKVTNTSASGSAASRSRQFYQQGVAKTKAREYQDALEDLDQAIALDPDFVDAYLQRCQVRYALRDDRGVLSDCLRLQQLAPDVPEVYYYLGLSRYRLGYTQSAIEAYGRAIAQDSRFAAAYYQRGLAHQDLDELEAAKADLQKAAAQFQAQRDWVGYEKAQTVLDHCNPSSSRRTASRATKSGAKRAAAKSSSRRQPLRTLVHDLGYALTHALPNPGGGLLPVFGQLEPKRAGRVGLIFAAIAAVCFTVGVQQSWQFLLPVSGLSLYIIGSSAFLILVALSGLSRLVTRRQMYHAADLFVAGMTVLPMGLYVLLSAIAVHLSLVLLLCLTAFTLCHLVITLYSGCTQILHLSEQSAVFMVPTMLLLSIWLPYLLGNILP